MTKSSEARVVRALRKLPWVRAKRGVEPLGLPDPIVVREGEKTLAEIVAEDRN